MLNGFGCYPVSIAIDLESYLGPALHTVRFRNRSGWLLIAEVRISSRNDTATYNVLAACEEYGQVIPEFQARHLLECRCSFPEVSYELPPQELDYALDHQVYYAKRRWLRETNLDLAASYEDILEEIKILESLTQRHIEDCDHQIADFRRRRRMQGLDPDHMALFEELITELEGEQDRAISALAKRRSALRANIASREDKLLDQMNFTVANETLYIVNWYGYSVPSQEALDVLNDLLVVNSLAIMTP
jgi:hypothetical protein